MVKSSPICHYCQKKYCAEPPLIPLLLQCGHTYCEGCLTRFARQVKWSGNINCPECGEVHYIENQKSVKQLQVNAHIYGVVTAPSRKTENAVDSVGLQVQGLTNKLNKLAMQQDVEEDENETTAEDNPEACCECKGGAELWCADCKFSYCTECSEQVHRLVALRNHTPGAMPTPTLFDTCPEHPDITPSSYLCLDGSPVCPDCPAPGDTAPLVWKDDQMDHLIQINNQVLESLLESDSCVTEILPIAEQDFARMRGEVRKEFAYFHGLLQAREHKVMEDLDKAQTNTVEPLLDMRYKIAEAIRSTRSKFNWILRNKDKKRILVKNQTKIQEIKEGIQSEGSVVYVNSEKRPTVSTKKGAIANCIVECCRINTDNVHQYELGRLDDTSRRRYKEDIPLFQPAPEREPANLSLGSLSAEPLTVTQASAEDREKVIVSTAYSPGCFYIQRCQDKDVLDELSNTLVKYYGLCTVPEDHLRSVSPGDLVCGRFTVDNLWYRARVVGVEEGDMVTVQYIDYGNSETTTLDRLRCLKSKFTHVSALAIQCAIFGVSPRDGQVWEAEGCESFTRMVEGYKEFEMIHLNQNGDIKEVDLVQYGSDVTSVREFMVLLEHACYSAPSKPAQEDATPELELSHGPPAPFSWPQQEGEYAMVAVSHVENPSSFFLHVHERAALLNQIGVDIAGYMESNGRKLPLKELKKGNLCVALYPGDGLYYRAVVLGAVDDFSVHVQYCDYGNRAHVSRTQLHEIPATLAASPQQSVECGLYGVKPQPQEERMVWSDVQITEFLRLTGTTQLFCKIWEREENGTPQVSLLDTTRGDEDIDIAKELVHRGLAFPTLQPEPQPAVTPEPTPGELSLGPVGTTHEVTLSNVETPHKISLHLSSHPYTPFFSVLNREYTRLAKLGNKVIERETSWNIGDMCVAYLTELQLYIRGRIVSFSIPQAAMVENIDQGKIQKVAMSNLKALIEDFNLEHTPKLAILCRLHDVQPLDESLQDKKIIRFFSKKIKKRKAIFTITVKDTKQEDGAWPVEMKMYDTVHKRNETVSEELVKLGLAKLVERNRSEAPAADYKDMQLTILERRGTVMHVDTSCTMYFTPDSYRSESVRLSAALASFQPVPPEQEVEWKVGCACVVKSEKLFYRGLVIILVGSRLLEVALVDIGTSQQFHISTVSPVFLCPDIPRLAVKLQMAFVQPAWHSSDGCWTKAASTYLYEKVVNEKCEIEIISNEAGVYRVNFRLLSGEKIGDLLVSKGYAITHSPATMSPRTQTTGGTYLVQSPASSPGLLNPSDLKSDPTLPEAPGPMFGFSPPKPPAGSSSAPLSSLLPDIINSITENQDLRDVSGC